MAHQAPGGVGEVTSQAGGPIAVLINTLQAGLGTVINWIQTKLDGLISPEKRKELKDKIMQFISQRPQLSAFLLSQIALSGVPLALFFTMSLSVLVFALLVGLIVGLLGAVLFTAFCVGLALIILLPTLFMTTFLATFIFLWGMGAYYILKWFNENDVPGIHTDFMDGMKKQMGLEGNPTLNGEAPSTSKQKPKQEANGEKLSNAHKEEGSKQKGDDVKRSKTPTGKGTGADHNPTSQVKKTAAGTASLG